MTYATKVYHEQGGDKLVIASGGEVKVESGGKVTAAGTQASHIADVATTGVWADDDDAIIAAINAILAALEGAGILASS